MQGNKKGKLDYKEVVRNGGTQRKTGRRAGNERHGGETDRGGLVVSAETFRGTFFQLLPVTGRSSHVELSLFQAWAPLSEFTD